MDVSSASCPFQHQIPDGLKGYLEYPQWVAWDYQDGVPTPYAECKPVKFDAAYKMCKELDLGLGFLLTQKDMLTVVHLPDCFDPETRMMHIKQNTIANAIQTYAEYDHAGNGIQLIMESGVKENAQGEGIDVWADDYLLPITGNRYGNETEICRKDEALRSVMANFCVTTWMDRVDQLEGSGSEEEILEQVLIQCLNTPNFDENPKVTGLYPFLAKCWVHKEIQDMIHSWMQNQMWTRKRRENFIGAIEGYLPKQEKLPKGVMVPEGLEGLVGQYQWTKQGQIKESQANWETALEQEPEWQGRLRFNSLLQSVELDGQPITEQSRAEISSWVSHNLELSGSNTKNRDQALLVVSAKDAYDPLKEYIDSLPAWDGAPRLETLFETYFGSESDAYAEWLGHMMPTSMVARALSPACICRYAVILKGPQELGKTETVRALGGEWTKELSGDLESRDSQILLKGTWVIELGELNSIRKSHIDAVKRFISARYDEYTPKYQNDPVRYPRRCIFIGTGNADEVLNDPTGATRWFPIKVTKADYKAIARDRDQLFAEALIWYRQHEQDWWVIPNDVKPLLTDIREESRVVGAYEERLIKWLLEDKPMDKKNKLSTTWSQIAEECLKLPESQWRGIQTNVTDTLRAMGWKRKQVRIEGSSYAKEWRWYPPDGWVDRYQEEQPDAGRQSRETEQPRNPPNEPDDDLELMLGKGHYASAVNGKAPCRQCNATAGVSLVDGLCGQCRIRQSAQPS